MQYEMVVRVTAEECDDLFGVLVPILEAMETTAYEIIGLPAPGGWDPAI